MEGEKLAEAQKTFEDDKEKFKTYKEELGKKAQDITAAVNALTTEKQEKIKRINGIMATILKVKADSKKIQEELELFLQQKAFLDDLAEQSGLVKKPTQNGADGNPISKESKSRGK